MDTIKQLQKIWKYGIGKTVAACFAAHTTSLVVGLTQGYSAILIPQLMTPNTDISINSDEASWVASLGVVSNPLGALMAGSLSEYIGRKRAVQFSSIPFIVGWSTVAIASDIYTVYVGRFIAGLAVGMITSTFTYIAEITPAQQRGLLSAFGPAITSFGVLLIYVLGYFLHWKHVAFICAIVSCSTLITMHLVPESPPWLITKRRKSDALESLLWLRGNNGVAQRDLDDLVLNTSDQDNKTVYMKTIVTLDNDDKKSASDLKPFDASTCCCNKKSIILSPKLYKPFSILVIFFLFQELTGIYIILFYSINFLQAVGTNMNEYISSIIIGSLRFLTSIIGAILIRKYARKTLALTSGLGMAGSLIICASYSKYYEDHPNEDKIFRWLPLMCIFCSVCFSMIGFLQLPYIMTGELFPLKVRGIMSGLVLSIANILIFISVKIYPNLLENLKLSGTLYLFGISSLLGGIYCTIFLPETMNKSLQEIEDGFVNKKHVPKDVEGKINSGFSISDENIKL